MSARKQERNMKEAYCNIVGPQIRRLRYNQGWSQAECAVKLQLIGLDISRQSLAKVESQIHNVLDHELLFYATAFGVGIKELYPPVPTGKPIYDVVVHLRSRRKPAPSQEAKRTGHSTPTRGAGIANTAPGPVSASAQCKSPRFGS